MKLAVFSPCVSTSAIGKVTLLVERELLKLGHEVTLVRTEDYDAIGTSIHSYRSRILWWEDAARICQLRDEVDMAIYQVGDNYPFHRGAIEWLSQWPGVVCLHDYFIGSLFRMWSLARLGQDAMQEAAISILRRWYEDEVATQFFTLDTAEKLIAASGVAPLTEWVASMAAAVITHSSWGIERVLKACPGPVRVIGLPFEAPEFCRSARAAQQHEPLVPSDSFTILTVGHMNRNKRVEQVIEAVGGSASLRQHARYILAGRCAADRRSELTTKAQRLGVDLVVLGDVDDTHFGEAVRLADVHCCLRYPSLESASASAIEAMLAGKAVIVTDTGFYRELPDDSVLKVSPEDEVTQLRSALEFLYEHPEERLVMGQHASEWAQRAFNPCNYASQLVEVCRLAATSSIYIQASTVIADILHEWGGTRERLVASGALPWLDFNHPGVCPAQEPAQNAVADRDALKARAGSINATGTGITSTGPLTAPSTASRTN